MINEHFLISPTVEESSSAQMHTSLAVLSSCGNFRRLNKGHRQAGQGDLQ